VLNGPRSSAVPARQAFGELNRFVVRHDRQSRFGGKGSVSASSFRRGHAGSGVVSQFNENKLGIRLLDNLGSYCSTIA